MQPDVDDWDNIEFKSQKYKHEVELLEQCAVESEVLGTHFFAEDVEEEEDLLRGVTSLGERTHSDATHWLAELYFFSHTISDVDNGSKDDITTFLDNASTCATPNGYYPFPNRIVSIFLQYLNDCSCSKSSVCYYTFLTIFPVCAYHLARCTLSSGC